ncbi:unnamed protein product, partial [marine sediment metagenome]
MPYKLVGGTRFYRRQEIKDIIAYLRVIHNPHDNVSLTRIINVPGRGIGQGTLNKLRAWARPHDTSLYGSLKQVVEEKTLSSRITQALARFIALIDELIIKSH